MRERWLRRIDASIIVQILRRYFDSNWYLVTVGALTLLGFASGADLYTMILTAALACLGMLVGQDLRPALPPTMMIVFQLSLEHSHLDMGDNSSAVKKEFSYFQSGTPLYILLSGFAVVAIAFLLHCWLRGPKRHSPARPGRLLLWSLPLVAALLFNGLLAPHYTCKNLAFGALTALLWVGVYLIYYHGLQAGEGSFFYGMRCCVAVLIVLLCQLLWHYLIFFDKILVDGEIQKYSIFFGWGVGNNYGGMVAMLLPACFCMAAYARRGWVFWLLGILAWAAILFSYCRSAIVVGSAIALASLVLVCAVGKHKKCYRIMLLVFLLLLALLLFFLWLQQPQVFAMYGERILNGFDDSGRYDIWEDGVDKFWTAPWFGIGFFNIPSPLWIETGLPGMLHNTLLQLLACGGILALLSYLIYRARSLLLFVQAPSGKRVFLLLMLLALLGTSLLDNHLFNLYPALFYSLCLALAEQDLDQTLQEKRNCLKGKDAAT